MPDSTRILSCGPLLMNPSLVHALNCVLLLNCKFTLPKCNTDNSVDVATGCKLDDRMIGFRFPAGIGNFSLRHRVQTDSGAHPASYPMGTGGSSPGDKAVRA
jgi:hypothetical protein